MRRENYSNGIPRNATADEIKKAYRKLALLSHPDKNPNDPTAASRFQIIGEAYETLKDEQKRFEYDNGGDDNNNNHNHQNNNNRTSSSRHKRRSERDDDERPAYDHRHTPNEDDDYFEKFDRQGIKITPRAFYNSCEICHQSSCTSFHRWYTVAGYIWDYQEQVSNAELARVMWDEFGASRPSLMRCTVCGNGSCQHPHRNYTREGAIAFFVAVMERRDGFASVFSALGQVEGLFGPSPVTSPSAAAAGARGGSGFYDYGPPPRDMRSSSYGYDTPNSRGYCGSRGGNSGRRNSGNTYGYSDGYNDGYNDGYSEGAPRDDAGYRQRGTTTYVTVENIFQGSRYSGRGISNPFGPSGPISREQDGSSSRFRAFFPSSSARSRYDDDDDRYGSSAPIDPDYYDDRDERRSRSSRRDRHESDGRYRERSSRRRR